MSEFKTGDVLRYLPSHGPHCREGMARVVSSDRIVDTYWGWEDSGAHVLSGSELEGAKVGFNVSDFDVLDCYSAASRTTWLTYHPRDRERLTSQHGLQELLFLRKDATPDLETQISNAQGKVEEAEEALRAAQGHLGLARAHLLELVGHRSTEG